MERIKQALERAREQRGEAPAAAAPKPTQPRRCEHAPATAPQEIVYTHTRQVEVDPNHVMIVPGGRVYPLAPGRTHVGRAHDNQIAIDARYSDVSRRHLAVDRTPGGRLRLTDLSSRGTWVELRAVGRG